MRVDFIERKVIEIQKEQKAEVLEQGASKAEELLELAAERAEQETNKEERLKFLINYFEL